MHDILRLLCAVLPAVLASIAFSAFWYSPKILGNTWVSLSGTPPGQAMSMRRMMVFTFFATLAMAFTLLIILRWADAQSAHAGLVIGVWVGLGLTSMSLLIPYLWEGRPLKLYLIVAGANLCNTILMSAIIAHLTGIFYR